MSWGLSAKCLPRASGSGGPTLPTSSEWRRSRATLPCQTCDCSARRYSHVALSRRTRDCNATVPAHSGRIKLSAANPAALPAQQPSFACSSSSFSSQFSPPPHRHPRLPFPDHVPPILHAACLYSLLPVLPLAFLSFLLR
eukprot:448027-Pyramimonas_sp.AAC.1